MKVVDVNVLVYAVNNLDPLHTRLKSWWESHLNGTETIGLTWNAMLGFLRVITNQRIFKAAMTVDEAKMLLQEWLDHPRTQLIGEKEDQWSVFDHLLGRVSSGKLVMDAHLAALAISHDATLVSCDTDFAKFNGLKWENPAVD